MNESDNSENTYFGHTIEDDIESYRRIKMNKLEKLQKATQRMLLEKDNKSDEEVTSEVVLENIAQIPINTIIEAAYSIISYYQSQPKEISDE